MKIARTVIAAAVLLTAASSIARAGKLAVSGRYRNSEIIGSREYAYWRKQVSQLRQSQIKADSDYRLYESAYRRTSDPRYYQTMQQILAAKASWRNRERSISSFLRGSTSVTVVSGRGGYYDRLPQLRWNDSVPEYLRRNKHLLGRSITLNSPQNSGGSSRIRPGRKTTTFIIPGRHSRRPIKTPIPPDLSILGQGGN